MQKPLQSELAAFLSSQGLPLEILPMIERYYLPLADQLAQKMAGHTRVGPLLLGINGAQGSGKSTLATALKIICRQTFSWNVAILSLDDLYLSSAERLRLAREVHPLLATRGVPGTHDVQLGMDTIAALRIAGAGDQVSLPRFDKTRDEPVPPEDWEAVHGPVDLLIFEGWCLGALPQADSELLLPCNELERIEDAEGVWRHYVNRQLAEVYPPLFACIDYQIFLKVPDFASVLRWRSEQEEQLRAGHAGEVGLMSTAELGRFVQYFERLTQHQLISMPAVSDVVFELDQAHCIVVAI